MYNCIIECTSCKEREVYFIMNKLKTIKKADNNIDTTNVDMIGEVKEIFKLADPAFDFRKDDDWKMTGKERLKRGVGAELVIDIGKQRKKYFESWLTSSILNPTIKISDDYFFIANNHVINGRETLTLKWDKITVKDIKTTSDDCLDYTDYKIVLSAGNRDYMFHLRINKKLQEFWNYWH